VVAAALASRSGPPGVDPTAAPNVGANNRAAVRRGSRFCESQKQRQGASLTLLRASGARPPNCRRPRARLREQQLQRFR